MVGAFLRFWLFSIPVGLPWPSEHFAPAMAATASLIFPATRRFIASARLRLRLPQHHQLHRPIPTRDRRIQTPTTPCIGEEPLFLGVGQRYDGNRQPVILS